MRQDNSATDIAIAAPVPFALRENWVGATRPMIAMVSSRAPILAVLTATTETYLAFTLIAGFARKLTYAIGVACAFFVWSVAKGFGGPYVPGTTTDIGAAIVYSLVLWALLLVDAGRMSVDRLIAARIPARRRIAG